MLLASAPLLAQPAPTGDPDPVGDPTAPLPDDGTGTQPGTDTGAAVTGTITVTLTVAEMQPKVVELDQQAEEDARHVLRLQIAARKDKDVIRLNCINDKLLQIKALRNIIEGAKFDFEGAVSSNNADEQQYQFTRVTLAAENTRQLREEANGCAGEIPDYVGDSTVDWTGPDIPDDPTDGFDTPIEPPGYASPFS